MTMEDTQKELNLLEASAIPPSAENIIPISQAQAASAFDDGFDEADYWERQPWWKRVQTGSEVSYPGYSPSIYSYEKFFEKKVDDVQVCIDQSTNAYKWDFQGTTAELLEATDITKLNTFIPTGNALWCMVSNPAFRIVHAFANQSFMGYPTKLEPGFKLLAPKIPGNLIAQILKFFRHFTTDLKMDKVTEAMAHVYWDSRNQEYFVNIPDQEVSGAAVHFNFSLDPTRCREEGVYKVLDIHSHNTMGSFFSGTDDRDETNWNQFFGVIGNIEATSHTWKFRFGIKGNFKDIQVEDIIDLSSFSEEGADYPDWWTDRVRFPQPASFQTTTEFQAGSSFASQSQAGIYPYSSPSYQAGAYRGGQGYDNRYPHSYSDASRAYNSKFNSHFHPTQTWYPTTTAPWAKGRKDWFEYLLKSLMECIVTPKEISKVLNTLLTSKFQPKMIVHRMRTIVGQFEAKKRKEDEIIASTAKLFLEELHDK